MSPGSPPADATTRGRGSSFTLRAARTCRHAASCAFRQWPTHRRSIGAVSAIITELTRR